MRYFRYGHVEKTKVKVGDIVKKGQLIAQNGTGNGQWLAHCHFDILTNIPTQWVDYVIGWSKKRVQANYDDPRGFEKIVMPSFDHLGLGWLEYWDYDSQSKKTDGAKSPAYHPGLDLNGPGSGNADLDDPIYSACDGEVVYVYNGTGTNSGWGQIIIIKENKNMEYIENYKKIFKAVDDFLDRNDGENPNDKETDEIVADIEKKQKELDDLNDGNKQLENQIEESESKISSMIRESETLEKKISNQADMLKAKDETIKELKEKTSDVKTLSIMDHVRGILKIILASENSNN